MTLIVDYVLKIIGVPENIISLSPAMRPRSTPTRQAPAPLGTAIARLDIMATTQTSKHARRAASTIFALDDYLPAHRDRVLTIHNLFL